MTIHVGPRVSSATGGSISTISGYTIHTFSTVGVNTFRPSTTGYVEVLVVGGGGASRDGAGGGGGSVLYQKFTPVLAGVAYTMNVGTGGPFTSPDFGGASTCRYNGGSITAPGGGKGGDSFNPAVSNPLGSSGGAFFPGGASASLSANIIGYGFSGGASTSGAAGGGGAGGVGQPGPGGQGGIGLSYSISGVSSYYGGGGGGRLAGGQSNPAGSFLNFGYGSGTGTPVTGSPGIIIIRYIT